MNHLAKSFRDLPWTTAPDGKPRRIGVEIEMAGVSLTTIAHIVHREYGGEIMPRNAFEVQIEDTEAGAFTVELDAHILKEQAYLDQLQRLGIELDTDDAEALDRWLADAAGKLVPHELVAPPVPLDQLPRLDRIRHELHQAGALGTHASLVFAFGLQLNLEVHQRDVAWLLPILQAFVLLYDPLVQAEKIDLTRRLSPYINPFPGAYIRLILQPDYQPDLQQFMDDYLEYNPTRNRPLDLLPLLAEIDHERVWAAPVEKELIKPRPALHYRLPSCSIDDPVWSLAQPFNGWAQVEHLAADRDLLAKTRAEYLRQPAQALGQWTTHWVQSLREWMP